MDILVGKVAGTMAVKVVEVEGQFRFECQACGAIGFRQVVEHDAYTLGRHHIVTRCTSLKGVATVQDFYPPKVDRTPCDHTLGMYCPTHG